MSEIFVCEIPWHDSHSIKEMGNFFTLLYFRFGKVFVYVRITSIAFEFATTNIPYVEVLLSFLCLNDLLHISHLSCYI